MDKLRALQTFIAIADHGTLTRAAEALGSSLPATVRTLAALEHDLGVRLMQRTTRRLALTEDGRLYLERARRIVADLDEADRAVGAQQAEPQGRVAVTASVLFGQLHVMPLLQPLLARHPQLQVELMLLDRVVNLVEEGLDIGVRIGPLADSTLVARRVGEMRRITVASPAFLRRHGVPAHPRELQQQACLHGSGPDGSLWRYREEGRALELPVRGPLSCNLSAPLLEACADGAGYARCLHYQAAALLRARRLKIVLEDFETEPWPVQVTYPSARHLSQRTRLVVEALCEGLSGALST